MTDLKQVKQAVERNMEEAEALARDIWAYAELPYCEEKSAGALCEALKREGFTVEAPVAGIPTCFIATFSCGSGKPAVGLLAEFDALDGLSQRAAVRCRSRWRPAGRAMAAVTICWGPDALQQLWQSGTASCRRGAAARWCSLVARQRKERGPNSLWPGQAALTG